MMLLTIEWSGLSVVTTLIWAATELANKMQNAITATVNVNFKKDTPKDLISLL
jgi:hypothetical protein